MMYGDDWEYRSEIMNQISGLLTQKLHMTDWCSHYKFVERIDQDKEDLSHE